MNGKILLKIEIYVLCRSKSSTELMFIILDKGIDTPSVDMFNQLSCITFPKRVTFQKDVMMYTFFNNLTPSLSSRIFKVDISYSSKIIKTNYRQPTIHSKS